MNRALLPIVAGQGMWVRATTRMAAPATGPTTGTVGDPSRETLRVGVLGDSTAAGCGVDTHDDGFAGCLARALAARTGRTVTWEVVGEFGATSRRVRYRLLPRLGDNLDIAVLLAGATTSSPGAPPISGATTSPPSSTSSVPTPRTSR